MSALLASMVNYSNTFGGKQGGIGKNKFRYLSAHFYLGWADCGELFADVRLGIVPHETDLAMTL